VITYLADNVQSSQSIVIYLRVHWCKFLFGLRTSLSTRLKVFHLHDDGLTWITNISFHALGRLPIVKTAEIFIPNAKPQVTFKTKEGSGFVIWWQEADHQDQLMEAKLVMSDSTIMFCCIMFSAMFVVVRCAGGHIKVGPNTMARLATAIRLTSR